MISHHHKCIFVHIPKCGGQSIETAFLHDIGLNFNERAPLLLRHNDCPNLGPPRLAHLKAKDYVNFKYITNEMFDEYFKFSIVRNPWSRAVSFYHYLGYLGKFEEFCKKALSEYFWHKKYWFVGPQVEFLQGKDDQIIIDNIYNLENVENAFVDIQRKIGLKSELQNINTARLNLTNPTIKARLKLIRAGIKKRKINFYKAMLEKQEYHDCWQEYYNKHSKSIIENLYRADILKFEYSFD